MKKNLLWTVLVIMLICSFLVVGCGKTEEEDSARIIEFGEWPQTIKPADVTVTEAGGVWIGSDGAYYTKVYAEPHRDNYTFSDGTLIEEGVAYYFKHEPIKWRVLSEEDGTAVILSEMILDAERYYWGEYTMDGNDSYIKSNTTSNGRPINTYFFSTIRSFLNDYFYSFAFIEDSDIERIKEKSVLSQDKVFLLEESDVLSAWNGFSVKQYADPARVKQTTDYARAVGAEMSTIQGSYGAGTWWLGSKHTIDKEVADALKKNGYPVREKTDQAAVVTAKGECDEQYVLSRYGVVPALRIVLS